MCDKNNTSGTEKPAAAFIVVKQLELVARSLSQPLSERYRDVVRTGVCAIVAASLSWAAVDAQPVRLPVYGVRHTTDAIRIDGVLDESTWALASRAGEIRRIDGLSRRPSFPTEATLAWDARALYMAFGCTDSTPSSRFGKRDDPLWDDEAVQVLVDPDGDGRNYVELAVNARNVIADRLVADASAVATADAHWNLAGIRTAVRRHRAGWVLEIAIPWSAFSRAGATRAPAAGEQWRAALFRLKRTNDGVEHSAWSFPRLERGAHDPERFGHLLFMPAASPQGR